MPKQRKRKKIREGTESRGRGRRGKEEGTTHLTRQKNTVFTRKGEKKTEVSARQRKRRPTDWLTEQKEKEKSFIEGKWKEERRRGRIQLRLRWLWRWLRGRPRERRKKKKSWLQYCEQKKQIVWKTLISKGEEKIEILFLAHHETPFVCGCYSFFWPSRALWKFCQTSSLYLYLSI